MRKPQTVRGGKSKRTLTMRRFPACNFSKDGSQVYGISHNTTGEGAEWQLYAVNVKTGAEKLITPALSHPSPKYQIWMLEGFAVRNHSHFNSMGANLKRGYATAGTDTGHEADGEDASWAYHHREKMNDSVARAGLHPLVYPKSRS